MADFESKAYQPCKEWIAKQIDSHKSWDDIKDLCVAPSEFDNELEILIDEESWPLRLNKSTWEFPGGKIEEGETPQQALAREIREELDTEITVGELIKTIEYDYPTFHLSMDCFWCEIVKGDLVLKEHEAAKWLTRSQLDEVDWLPADLELIDSIKREWNNYLMDERIVDTEITLIPYYPNPDETLPWYQDHDVVKMVDNRDEL